MVERVGLDSPDSGIEGVVNRAYKQLRKRKREQTDLPMFYAEKDTIFFPPKRSRTPQSMGPDIKAFLAKIRPASTKKLQEPTGPYSISSMMKRVGVMQKGNKKTSRHGLFGWYLHGMKAGGPKPGRKAAMLTAYAEKALKAYKSPSSGGCKKTKRSRISW